MKTKIVVVVSGILKDKSGRILLLKRSASNKSNKGKWQLPEGKMEFGESVQETLEREISEETNLKVAKPKLLTVTTTIMKVDTIRYHVVRIVFNVNWKGKIALSKDHSGHQWFKKEELAELNMISGLTGLFNLK